tara:strand:- start:3165 stop:4217 length:1053 start_codon:yes stop_codon:yes gene_type:complete
MGFLVHFWDSYRSARLAAEATLSDQIGGTFFSHRDDLSQALGAEVWLKREDTFDNLGSGHKMRKLYFLANDIVKSEADILVTAGSIPSSQCSAAAALANKLKIDSHIVYTGDTQEEPEQPYGNYLLTKLMASKISWIEKSPWDRVNSMIELVANDEIEQGKRPFSIMPGMTNINGLFGSFDLGVELCENIKRELPASVIPQIVLAAGTGTTSLGVALALKHFDIEAHVYGITIGGDKSNTEESIARLLVEAKIPEAENVLQNMNINICQYHRETPYDKPDIVELKTMQDCLNRYQVIFDSNYMVKVYIGLQKLLNDKIIDRTMPVILIHSGGHYGIFGSTPNMRDWFNNQ